MESVLEWGICVLYAFKIMLVAHGKLLVDGIGAPLRWLYLFGPSLLGWGFWEGKTAAEVCSRLTNVEAAFWERDLNRGQCLELIEAKVHAFSIGAVVVAVWMIVVLWIGMKIAATFRNKALSPVKG